MLFLVKHFAFLVPHSDQRNELLPGRTREDLLPFTKRQPRSVVDSTCSAVEMFHGKHSTKSALKIWHCFRTVPAIILSAKFPVPVNRTAIRGHANLTAGGAVEVRALRRQSATADERRIRAQAQPGESFMGRIIAVANQKGGVGKTTTAINLAASLAAAEVNTLLVDCDPQSNTTSGLGLVKDPERINIYDVIMGAATAEEALRLTDLEQLWLIPSHKNLIGANLELVAAERREYRLRDALKPLRERFRFIVLDCPPALDLLTLNALVAADGVLIPMQAEYFALEGISELLDTILRIQGSLNSGLKVEGVLLTMFDERTNLAQQVAEELRSHFGEALCQTTIPRNIRLAEAPSHGKPALVYDARSRGSESYLRLAKEIIEREQGQLSVVSPRSPGAVEEGSGGGAAAGDEQRSAAEGPAAPDGAPDSGEREAAPEGGSTGEPGEAA